MAVVRCRWPAALAALACQGSLMTDEKTAWAPRDEAAIDLEQLGGVEYWTRTLGVSEHRLHELVAKLGTSVHEVRRALGAAREPIRLLRRCRAAAQDDA